MTPTQLRAFAAVVRTGSVKSAAAGLEVSEAAVSLHVGQLRKELGDPLFTRTAAGLAFTPGGLRLASRAAELLGLQDRTVLEVSQAGRGRRMLRVAASASFAEHAAPGLIELFVGRADDLDVELSVHASREFVSLLLTRAVDVAIGALPAETDDAVTHKVFLNHQLVTVAAPSHPLTRVAPGLHQLREATWLLGPSAVDDTELVHGLLGRIGVPEGNQRIFQSHAAALDEAMRGHGIAPTLSFAVQRDVSADKLARIAGGGPSAHGSWSVLSLEARSAAPTALEFMRFVQTPRAIQAMLRGSGIAVGRFRPSIHVTLWN